MGYGIMPYSIKTSEIAALFGSWQLGLQSRIAFYATPRFERLDKRFPAPPKMADVMKEYLQGKISYPNAGFKYWYAIELLIQHTAEIMVNNAWSPADSGALSGIPELKMYKLDTSKPLPWPEDFPLVYVIANADLDAALTHAKETISDPAQLSEFTSWYNNAKAAGNDLVLYYY